MTMQLIEPLHTVRWASRLVERTAPCAFLEFMTAGKHPATLTNTIFSLSHRDLARRCSQCNGITEKRLTIHVRAKNSNGTTVGKFLIFNLLRGRLTLLPSFRSLPHYALLVLHKLANIIVIVKELVQTCFHPLTDSEDGGSTGSVPRVHSSIPQNWTMEHHCILLWCSV